MVLRFSRGRVGSRLFKPVPDKGAGFLVSLSERGCFLSRDIIISGLEGGAADYILTIPSPLSSFSLLMFGRANKFGFALA